MSNGDITKNWMKGALARISKDDEDLEVLRGLDPAASSDAVVFLNDRERKIANAVRRSLLVAMVSHFEQTLKRLFRTAIELINQDRLIPNCGMKVSIVRKALRRIAMSHQQTDNAVTDLMNLCAEMVIHAPCKALDEGLVSRIVLSGEGMSGAFHEFGIDDIFFTMASLVRTTDIPSICVSVDRGWTQDRIAAYLKGIQSMLAKRNDLVHSDFEVEIPLSDLKGYTEVAKDFLEGAALVIESFLEDCMVRGRCAIFENPRLEVL